MNLVKCSHTSDLALDTLCLSGSGSIGGLGADGAEDIVVAVGVFCAAEDSSVVVIGVGDDINLQSTGMNGSSCGAVICYGQ